ncbi:hypothetical protein SARC_09127 [Sphaeroforma arctica JP610]|uniref:Uncharacterized protein n=1 Tax=Sphaeroforma arctica JP610 TaxID=667725 RepID=A0A0L0FNX0_9EUKA|nr:hypothetical protein SARC_09127 [Sphaeroforma arctica JP610]KNC78439.1 hypothetical protein SARC_09127 [Sphaeroforma arctica JP610]|eukprot:XP_014152341.1 hypothetical protein SARC_09127 [Sphaeroforma arctica JP610]
MKSPAESYIVSKLKSQSVDEELHNPVRLGTPPRASEQGVLNTRQPDTEEESLDLDPLDDLVWGESDSESCTESSDDSEFESIEQDFGYSCLAEILHDFGKPISTLDWEEKDKDEAKLLQRLSKPLPIFRLQNSLPQGSLRPKVRIV